MSQMWSRRLGLQFVADNVDHNIRTRDGCLHKGIIASTTPSNENAQIIRTPNKDISSVSNVNWDPPYNNI